MKVSFRTEYEAGMFQQQLTRMTGKFAFPVVDASEQNARVTQYHVHTGETWVGHYIEILRTGFDHAWLPWQQVLLEVYMNTDPNMWLAAMPLRVEVETPEFPGMIKHAWRVVAAHLGVEPASLDAADRLGGLALVSTMVSDLAKEVHGAW